MLRVRWLGRVRYRDADALQHGLYHHSADDHLLLLEHPHVYTLGVGADPAHVLVDPAAVGAEVVRADRGGDVTYHGPGQLVGYPILSVAGKGGAHRPADTLAYVRSVEQLVIDALAAVGLPGAARLEGYPGVWIDADGARPRKICAIGVRLSRGRSMHGFALNVDPDLAMFDHIVPCGIADKGVTSLAAEGLDLTLREMVDTVAELGVQRWGGAGWERADVVWRHDDADLAPFSRGEGPGEPVGPDDHQAAGSDQSRSDPSRSDPSRSDPSRSGPSRPELGRVRPAAAPVPVARAARGTSVHVRRRLHEAGVTEGLEIAGRKPDWARAHVTITPGYTRLKHTMRDLNLVTVCEEAGCPNIFECWSAGTATFMVNGERCTRACGFCLVDTRKPMPPDPAEPGRVAEAVARMGVRFAVITTVARDDLPDGGAGHIAATIAAVRARNPGVLVEALVSDCKGDPASLRLLFEAAPDVFNHNVETVARLQRAVRPSASYARSLGVLARAKAAGMVTKSSLMVGIGETDDEVTATLGDLRGVGVDIVTIGQYLRPTSHHLPVTRWVTPATFAHFAEVGEAMGITHVESSPLTRSSYHAAEAAAAAGVGAAVGLAG